MKKEQESRRSFIYLLLGGVGLAAVYPVINALSQSSLQQGKPQRLAATPNDSLGPFYKKGAPRKEKLGAPDDSGTPLMVSGRVVNTEGEALPATTLEVFHTDNSGNYDMQGFHFRGQVTARIGGEYNFETIIPGQYGGRPKHIHYVVNAPGHKPLITQLYFDNDSFFGGNPDQNSAANSTGGRELIRPVTLIGQGRQQRASVVFDVCLVKI
jgi:protocatechuate 3,4-dioxygenase beta subunit